MIEIKVFVKNKYKSDTAGKLLGITMALALLVISPATRIYAQKTQTPLTRQSSIDTFNGGNYEEALNGFTQLLEKYPKDPLYKFYSGASLVMLKKDPERALTLLTQSVSGASVVRSLPPESYFYLGRAQQMCGKFSDAIGSYNTYTDEAGKKASRELGIPAFIQECEGRKGMITAADAITVRPASENASASGELAKPKENQAVPEITTVKPGVSLPVQEKEAAKPLENPPVTQAFKKVAENPMPEKSNLPPQYEAVLDDALKLQSKADSLTRVAADLKKQLEQVPESDKSPLRVKIYQTEMQAASLQKSADARYTEAQNLMNSGKSGPATKADTSAAAQKMVQVPKNEEKKIQEQPIRAEPSKQSGIAAAKPTAVVSLFHVLPKDAVYPDEAIKVDPVVPAGLIYRIQLAVFRNPAPPSFFKGITPVYGFRVSGSDKTNYYAGMFRRAADAKKALIEVRETGFKDAFIIALADSKAVSTDRAAMLENEWGNKSLIDMSQPGIASDTVPPALVFRVEIARSLKPLKPDALEALKTTAGNRGLDILHLSDGNLVYLIGKFITFESAAEFADLLVRNNYRDAKVVAWLGNKEVPVETAKQLFKGL